MLTSDASPEEIAAAKGFEAMDTGAMAELVDGVIDAPPRRVGALSRPERRRRQGREEAHRLLRRPGHAAEQGQGRRQAVTERLETRLDA